MFRQKKKKKEVSGLLLPIYLIVAVLPFVTRMLLYDCGLSEYSWFSKNPIITDFFSYYKSYTFGMISIVAGILLICVALLYRETWKNLRAFLPLGVYMVMVILSTIFSTNQQISMVGGMAHFENALVLCGYVIVCLYAYEIVKSEDDLKSIQKVFFLSALVMCVIGIFQMTGNDLMNFRWVQKLIIPTQYQSEYLGEIQSNTLNQAVSLTLFNANYAAIYLVMVISFFLPEFIFLLRDKSDNRTTKNNNLLRKATINKATINKDIIKKATIRKAVIILFITVATVLLAKTYSRVSFVALFVIFLLFCIFYRHQLKQLWRPIAAVLCLILILFLGVDSLSDFRFLTKIQDTFASFSQTKQEDSLETILTEDNGIQIKYNGSSLLVSFQDITAEDKTLQFYDEEGNDLTGSYDENTGVLEIEPFQTITFTQENNSLSKEDSSYIIATIKGTEWRFCYVKAQGYLYENAFGKLDKFVEIESFGFRNHENIASGRGYIWSRSLPLLKNTLLIGSGPDTFPIVYPQNDYVGKANNCSTPVTLIEKPHNLYLMIGIQTGMLSLLAFLWFCLAYIIKSFRIYRNRDFTKLSERVGLGCLFAVIAYLVCGIFNDSSLQTTPIFFLLLGVGMASNHLNYKE
ncbi:MAG: O-antigen ligase family protein [Mobilitalea sp.]